MQCRPVTSSVQSYMWIRHADIAFCGISLSPSLLGVKRTSLFALQMSAFDPKRTCDRLPYRHACRGFRNRARQKLGDATIAPVVHMEFVRRQESAEREVFRQAPIAH